MKNESFIQSTCIYIYIDIYLKPLNICVKQDINILDILQNFNMILIVLSILRMKI